MAQDHPEQDYLEQDYLEQDYLEQDYLGQDYLGQEMRKMLKAFAYINQFLQFHERLCFLTVAAAPHQAEQPT